MLLQIEVLIIDQIKFFGGLALALAILFFLVKYFMAENKKQRDDFQCMVNKFIENMRKDNTSLMISLDKSSDAQKELAKGLIELSKSIHRIPETIQEQTRTIEKSHYEKK